MATQNQGTGTYSFGAAATPANYTDELISVKINENVATTERPATFASNVVEQHPAASSYEMEIEWLGDPDSSTSIFNIFRDALEAGDKTVAFDILFLDGAASATNKRYTGSVVITQLSLGAPMNEFWTQSATFPIISFDVSDS